MAEYDLNKLREQLTGSGPARAVDLQEIRRNLGAAVQDTRRTLVSGDDIAAIARERGYDQYEGGLERYAQDDQYRVLLPQMPAYGEQVEVILDGPTFGERDFPREGFRRKLQDLQEKGYAMRLEDDEHGVYATCEVTVDDRAGLYKLLDDFR